MKKCSAFLFALPSGIRQNHPQQGLNVGGMVLVETDEIQGIERNRCDIRQIDGRPERGPVTLDQPERVDQFHVATTVEAAARRDREDIAARIHGDGGATPADPSGIEQVENDESGLAGTRRCERRDRAPQIIGDETTPEPPRLGAQDDGIG